MPFSLSIPGNVVLNQSSFVLDFGRVKWVKTTEKYFEKRIELTRDESLSSSSFT